ERDLCGKLGEPAEVGDDEGLAERECPDRTAGRLAHGRRPEADAGVARGHQRPEARLVDVVLAEHALRELESLQTARGRADEQQAGLRASPAQGLEGTEELRDALGLVQMAEAAEERTPVHGGRLDVGYRPRGMGYPPDGAVEAGGAGAILDVSRVDDQAGGEPQDLTGQRELLRPRLPQRG